MTRSILSRMGIGQQNPFSQIVKMLVQFQSIPMHVYLGISSMELNRSLLPGKYRIVASDSSMDFPHAKFTDYAFQCCFPHYLISLGKIAPFLPPRTSPRHRHITVPP